jgi:hypothetical protein
VAWTFCLFGFGRTTTLICASFFVDEMILVIAALSIGTPIGTTGMFPDIHCLCVSPPRRFGVVRFQASSRFLRRDRGQDEPADRDACATLERDLLRHLRRLRGLVAERLLRVRRVPEVDDQEDDHPDGEQTAREPGEVLVDAARRQSD